MSTKINVTKNNPVEEYPTFKDVAVGEIFGMPNEPEFIAMCIQPLSENGYNAIVLKASSQYRGKVQPGHFTLMMDDYRITRVMYVNIVVDNV